MAQEEVEDEAQREVRDLQEEQSRLRSLTEHTGFKYLREVLQEQVKVRTQAIILTPLNSLDETLHQEYSKGEAAGISLAERFVEIRLTDLAEQIEERLKPKSQVLREGNES